MYVILVEVEGEDPDILDEAADDAVLANELISEHLRQYADGKQLVAPGQLHHDHDTMIGELHFVDWPTVKLTAIAIERVRR